ncbi:TPA: hypothetical protein HA265_05040 [Candidatus Woesearchaeota archaeon]|nr:hypothetical protein [Candidatus Woesearchaeota archaeon]
MINIKKLLIFLLLIAILPAVIAQEHDTGEAETLIESGVSCDDLSEVQLEMIGEYFMDQMHPDEEHEIMDEMMGGEGSVTLEQAHIEIGRMFYCGERTYGMMGMMGPGSRSRWAEGSGMMGDYGYYPKREYYAKTFDLRGDYTMGYGMMGSGMSTFGYIGWWLLKLLYFAIGSFIFAVIFWATHGWLNRCCQHDKKEHKKK